MFNKIKLSLLGIVLLALLYPLQSFSQNDWDEYNMSFTVYTNNMYSSGDEVSVNVYAYYLKKNTEFNFKVYKIRDIEGFFSRQLSNSQIDVLSKDSLNLLSMCDEVDNFNKKLKVEGSDNYYYSYETITYKPKEKGAFVIRVSYKNKVAYTGFFVTDIGTITEASNNALLAYTVDKKTGEPINDVDLSFFIGTKKIGVGKTLGGLFYKSVEDVDRQYAAENSVSYPLIIGRKGDDIAVSDPYLYFGYGANMYTVYIYPSQPVYRPKSKVEFKGTIRKTASGGFDNYPDKDITVKIKDSKNAEVFKQVVRTNSNGSFNGEFFIEENAALGQYFIYASLDKDQEYTGSFFVEEYKKPEYKVGITLDKDQYTNGDNIKGVVQADYYFGSAVQDAEVEYNVYKKTFYKPWWYFSEYKWWYEEYYANQDDNQKFNNADFIYSGTGKLNKEGRFDFDYSIKEDFKSKYKYWWYYDNDRTYETDFIYIIQAKVTDKSRREISSTQTVYVTRADFFLTAKADKYLYKPDEKITLEIRAMDFSEKPRDVKFEAVVNRVTWGGYPNYKQEKEYVTTVSGNTNNMGMGTATFDAAGEGYYSIEVSSYDTRGKKVTEETYCYVSKGDMWWWYNQSGAVQIFPDKDSYKPGEVCKALIVTTTPGANVLITTQNDNILSYKVEKIDGTSKLIEIPVEENATPNFYISVSYVSGGQFYSASKSVMVMPEKKFLTVNIGTDKTTYKPKEEGTVSVRVTDKDGNPVRNAEVSIGIVDESIYAIKPDAVKDIKSYFYAPKWNTVSVHYSNAYSYYSYSRLITIYERFDVKSLRDSELGTIKGRLTDKNGNAMPYATIIIDGDFVAATTGEDGSYEFKLPEGSYTIGVMKNKRSKESDRDLNVIKGKTIEVNLKSTTGGLVMDGLTDDFQVSQQSVVTGEVSLRNGRSNDETKTMNAPKTEDEKMKKESKGDFFADKDSEEGGRFIDAEVRSDFRDAIMWQPTVTTDENGYATVQVKFPDNLTSWRITSRVITDDTKVGQNVNTIITRKDLLVRMETPRFFQQNDEVTISTIVHNYLETEKETKLSLKTENLEIIGDSNEKVFTMGKNEEKRIDWRVKVNDPMGFAKLTATALTNEESDAVELKVPLQPHGLKLASYQSMDISDANKSDYKFVNIPEYTDLRSTKLTLNVAPSLASTMLTALDELVGYPYGCVEQTMSRFMPTVIVANAFKDLNAPISEATKKDLPKMVDAGYNRLYSMQHYDGGWGWWTNDQSNPFMTAYVVYGLTLGNSAGYPVRQDVYKKGITAIKTQLQNEVLDASTRAYMLYALSYAEGKDTKLFEEQFEILSKAELNDYAVALLSMAASNIGDKETAMKYSKLLVSHVQEMGESGSYWGGKTWHYSWQDDKVQTTAMAVKALLAEPSSMKDNPELMNKAIRWLMQQRQGGSWWNTQSTAFIIYAMVDYLKASKELEPDYTVKLYVNGEMILDKKMTREDVFLKDLKFVIEGSKLKAGQNDIKIEKSGEGKVYISTDLRYYTSEGKIQPRENGFRVQKEYFKLEKYSKYGEDNKITYRKRFFDGSVKSGDEILVKVRVEAKDKDLQYFMLEDPIPAGCEVIKDDWAYTIEEEKDYSGWDYYWWRWWYADKDIRDNRVTFFATYLYGDTYEFTYIMRAQIPGSYNVIPATGMLMYYPDVMGSSEELKIEITD
ncbi:MAG: carboxypeptidase regulatory-like domain-containing protein [Ignavibacteria bacterium]|nr:carboxypeptidase regulatory-like domain-containing protein [Ignavibacteria bacterium]